ncbi:alpha-E domain-containing protein [Verticiella sediminum]|uniref:Alpha-E domain-containing protein n=1 Tax=Verticiella sediminum TaxID=1247510 RepID=A0A556A7X3_9BURK|nr:alpha-E domain-containing protein [Verticiella sediminum]TSH88989.1 alpha-E domain-containing protein [Verticiella sediminum]
MLSRTADSLFWMARYMERAENTARMLDVNVQLSLLPQSPLQRRQPWRSVLGISELRQSFDERYDEPSARNVIEFMVRDESNPSSIYSCLRAARECARAVRGSLTTELWQTYNVTWLELQRRVTGPALQADPRAFFEWVKFRSHLSRGVMIGTMLRDEALAFQGLGAHLEQADCTARLLDVACYEQPAAETQAPDEDAASIDPRIAFYHWSALLHAVSGFEIYRKVYRDVLTPNNVIELLVFNSAMPRSLLCGINDVIRYLVEVGTTRSRETERQASILRAQLERGRVEDILDTGVHAFLTDFLDRVNDLGNRISQDFLVPIAD